MKKKLISIEYAGFRYEIFIFGEFCNEITLSVTFLQLYSRFDEFCSEYSIWNNIVNNILETKIRISLIFIAKTFTFTIFDTTSYRNLKLSKETLMSTDYADFR